MWSEQWSENHSVLSDSLQPHGIYCSWISPGQNIGVGNLSLLQGIFPTQGLNPGLLHCRQILYQLSHRGSPRILEWVVYPFYSGSSQPRNLTEVSCIAGGFFTNWDIRGDKFWLMYQEIGCDRQWVFVVRHGLSDILRHGFPVIFIHKDLGSG